MLPFSSPPVPPIWHPNTIYVVIVATTSESTLACYATIPPPILAVPCPCITSSFGRSGCWELMRHAEEGQWAASALYTQQWVPSFPASTMNLTNNDDYWRQSSLGYPKRLSALEFQQM
jgi:hypothetical protein